MNEKRKFLWDLENYEEFNEEIQYIYELLSIYYDNHIVLEDYNSREYCFNDYFYICDLWDNLIINTEFVDIRYSKVDYEYYYISNTELLESELLYVMQYLYKENRKK